MFGIGAPIEEARSEPSLPLYPVPSAQPISAATTESAADVCLPVARLRRPLPGSSTPSDGAAPLVSQDRRWPFGPAASLILHLLPLLLLLNWPMHPPAEITPIPVQLVLQPPPMPKPLSKPRPKPETRPPPGRIASENIGDVQAKGQDQAKSDAPSANKQPAATLEAPLEAPKQLAFLPPPPALPDPPKLELPKPPEPKPLAARKPPPRPSAAARQPIRPVAQRAHLLPRFARYPGPAATRDEYLAYLAYLARQHIGLLSPAVIAGRRGETIINVLVLDDGTVARISIAMSSGYPDIDERVEQMIVAVGRFPPLPQWYQGDSMRLEFRLQFPEALED